MLTPRHCDAFRCAFENLDHGSSAPAVELNRQKVDPFGIGRLKCGSDPLNPRSLSAGTKILFRDESMSSHFIGNLPC